MQREIGAVTEGKVTGITKFGAFVEIEKGITGLVHISEISKFFVVEISNFLKVGDIVKVKILNKNGNKLSLSIKQAQEEENFNEINRNSDVKENISKNSNSKTAPKKTKEAYKMSFEEMLSKFKKNSEEKMYDIRKNLDDKRRSYSKKR